MAIALDTTTTGSGGTSWSHTCTGSNLILWVHTFGGTSAVTYNSVSMISAGTVASGAGRASTELWYLVNPATGSNTITLTGGSGNGAASYTGAKQTGQLDSTNTSTVGTAQSSITISTTVVDANSWLVIATADGQGGETGGTGTTIRRLNANGLALADSNAGLGAGSRSLQVVFGGSSTTSAGVIASFKPSIDVANIPDARVFFM